MSDAITQAIFPRSNSRPHSKTNCICPTSSRQNHQKTSKEFTSFCKNHWHPNLSKIQNTLRSQVPSLKTSSNLTSHFISNDEKQAMIENLWALWEENNSQFLAMAHKRDLPFSMEKRKQELNNEMNQIEDLLRLLKQSEVHLNLTELQDPLA